MQTLQFYVPEWTWDGENNTEGRGPDGVCFQRKILTHPFEKQESVSFHDLF